jgi:hypothetical protein
MALLQSTSLYQPWVLSVCREGRTEVLVDKHGTKSVSFSEGCEGHALTSVDVLIGKIRI